MKYSHGEYALIFKALSDETRLKIICQLRGGDELCACKLLENLNITQPTLSYHMKCLGESGLVNGRKDANWMRYTINADRIDELNHFLGGLKAAKNYKELFIMRMLAEFYPEFVEKLNEIDAMYEKKRTIDEKTYQFICFALSIKARSKPCVLKHFKGALEAGATVEELTYILALTMREAAGADDCWTHDVLGDWKEIIAGNIKCACEE